MTRFSVRVTPGVGAEAFPGCIGEHGPKIFEAHLRGGRAELYSDDCSNCVAQYPAIMAWLETLPARDIILLGSVKQSAKGQRFEVEDLLHLDGFGLRQAEKAARRELLDKFLAEAGDKRRR